MGCSGAAAEGYQLTWMDAKVDGWVVTPRRGKPVEIQALWYNALKLMAAWAEELGADHRSYAAHANRARETFNERFWNARAGCLYDVIDGPDGNDASIRPNQVFAISLPHPILYERHWEPVIETVRNRLLTAYGLRTLSAEHPDYKAHYRGDLRSRDAAYHQGTVWPWLIGPVHRRRTCACVPTVWARANCCAHSPSICAKQASAVSAKSSTPKILHSRRLHRASVERRRSPPRLAAHAIAVAGWGTLR
jgi:hypothetical protein